VTLPPRVGDSFTIPLEEDSRLTAPAPAFTRISVVRVGLFVPCYIDAFEPEVGIATLELLERLGCTVEYPYNQTCCGQPMTNTGCHREAIGAEELFVRNFTGYDYIVAPSGSCVHQVRVNMTSVEQTDDVKAVRARTFELTEFLHDILRVKEFPWLEKVAGIEFVQPARWDECCGFGGTFSVFDAAVAVKMGQDKVADHSRAGAEYIVSADSSCMLHQKGCAEHLGNPIKFMHIARILNGASA
jgi:L-lactate dehydrogenase complex protein LldE